uniref:Uncharacterized protein n=1 Tax=Corchorus capsularis TaxID=210143 RepID=A0A1R3I8X4_COCAP|nr:hypothetical protein CCACVL1_13942 [Corchorus capsularis]
MAGAVGSSSSLFAKSPIAQSA